MNEIQDYRPADLQVIEVAGNEVVFLSGDQRLARNSVVRFTQGSNSTTGRVISLEGTGQVRAQMLHDAAWLAAGASVEWLADGACVSGPAEGVRVGDLEFQAEGVPFVTSKLDLPDVSGRRAPLSSPWAGLNAVAPLVRGGFNLVIDQSKGGFERLAEIGEPTRIWVNQSVPNALSIQGETDYERWMAFRIAAAWAANLRDSGEAVTLIAKLPRHIPNEFVEPYEKVQSLTQLTDDVFESLTSSESVDITVILGLALEPDDPVGSIVETLSLGHFDAQVFVNPDGSLDLLKSTSSADLDPEAQHEQQQTIRTLSHALQIREKTAIFGEFDLEESELKTLALAESKTVNLLSINQRS